MRNAIIVFFSIILSLPSYGQEKSTRNSWDPVTLSLEGYTGLITIPVADVISDGGIGFGFSNNIDYNITPGIKTQQNYYFTIGFLPRLELGARLTATNTNTMDRDHSTSFKFRLLNENQFIPSIVFGSQDPIGTGFLTTNFLVFSKSFLDRVRCTLGYGTGPKHLKGLFYGLEGKVNKRIILMAEYDTKYYNAGLRILPFSGFKLDIVAQDMHNLAFGLCYKFQLGEAHKDVSVPLLNRPDGYSEPERLIEIIQKDLIERGFENVLVRYVQDHGEKEMIIEYENRIYIRNELDALGIALSKTIAGLPRDIDRITVIIKNLNIPVLKFSIRIDDYLSFINGKISTKSFARKVTISNDVGPHKEIVEQSFQTGLGNRSRFRTDLLLRPGIQTTLGGEVSLFDASLSLQPDAFVILGKGTIFNIRADIPIARTFEQKPADTFDIDRILLHHAFRPFYTVFTQTSIGLFNIGNRGFSNETAVILGNGRLVLKTIAGYIFDSEFRSYAKSNRKTAVISFQNSISRLNLQSTFTFGQFLDNDRGIAIDVDRFFGNTKIGFFLRETESRPGALAGISLSIPLAPSKEFKPGLFRLRPADFFDYEHRKVVLTNLGYIRNDEGRILWTGNEIGKVFFDRDRLTPAYIKEHLDKLKK